MKLPRDIGGEELSRLLGRLGYEVTRQAGSQPATSDSLGAANITSLFLVIAGSKSAHSAALSRTLPTIWK